MPSTARELRGQLGLPQNNYGYIPEVVSLQLPPGHALGKPSPLFSKIEDQQLQALRSKYAGRQDSSPPRDDVKPEELEAAVAKQAELVRDLKAKGDKSVWQPQVKILLDLKNRFAKLKEGNKEAPAPTQQNGADSQEILELEAAVLKQVKRMNFQIAL